MNQEKVLKFLSYECIYTYGFHDNIREQLKLHEFKCEEFSITLEVISFNFEEGKIKDTQYKITYDDVWCPYHRASKEKAKSNFLNLDRVKFLTKHAIFNCDEEAFNFYKRKGTELIEYFKKE